MVYYVFSPPTLVPSAVSDLVMVHHLGDLGSHALTQLTVRDLILFNLIGDLGGFLLTRLTGKDLILVHLLGDLVAILSLQLGSRVLNWILSLVKEDWQFIGSSLEERLKMLRCCVFWNQ